MLNIPNQQAKLVLEKHNWNVETSIENFFNNPSAYQIQNAPSNNAASGPSGTSGSGAQNQMT